MDELLHNPLKLYRDCLRIARLLAAKQRRPEATAAKSLVQQTWRQHQREENPEKVKALRVAAVRGLHNYLMFEAARAAKAGVAPFAPETP